MACRINPSPGYHSLRSSKQLIRIPATISLQKPAPLSSNLTRYFSERYFNFRNCRETSADYQMPSATIILPTIYQGSIPIIITIFATRLSLVSLPSNLLNLFGKNNSTGTESGAKLGHQLSDGRGIHPVCLILSL